MRFNDKDFLKSILFLIIMLIFIIIMAISSNKNNSIESKWKSLEKEAQLENVYLLDDAKKDFSVYLIDTYKGHELYVIDSREHHQILGFQYIYLVLKDGIVKGFVKQNYKKRNGVLKRYRGVEKLKYLIGE